MRREINYSRLRNEVIAIAVDRKPPRSYGWFFARDLLELRGFVNARGEGVGLKFRTAFGHRLRAEWVRRFATPPYKALADKIKHPANIETAEKHAVEHDVVIRQGGSNDQAVYPPLMKAEALRILDRLTLDTGQQAPKECKR